MTLREKVDIICREKGLSMVFESNVKAIAAILKGTKFEFNGRKENIIYELTGLSDGLDLCVKWNKFNGFLNNECLESYDIVETESTVNIKSNSCCIKRDVIKSALSGKPWCRNCGWKED